MQGAEDGRTPNVQGYVKDKNGNILGYVMEQKHEQEIGSWLLAGKGIF